MTLPAIEIPVYEVKLPTLNKTVKYKPYTVKEEKILLMAIESNDEKQIFETSLRCCDSCILDDSVKIEELSVLDLELLMISIRSKSVGETVDVRVTCEECNHTLDIKADITKMKVKKKGKPKDTIMLDETYGVKLKLPSIDSVYDSLVNKTDELTSTLLACIDFVYDDETTYSFKDYTEEEKTDFIEKMTVENVKKINELFIDKLPSNCIDLSFTCPSCGKENKKTMENLLDFFI